MSKLGLIKDGIGAIGQRFNRMDPNMGYRNDVNPDGYDELYGFDPMIKKDTMGGNGSLGKSPLHPIHQVKPTQGTGVVDSSRVTSRGHANDNYEETVTTGEDVTTIQSIVPDEHLEDVRIIQNQSAQGYPTHKLSVPHITGYQDSKNILKSTKRTIGPAGNETKSLSGNTHARVATVNDPEQGRYAYFMQQQNDKAEALEKYKEYADYAVDHVDLDAANDMRALLKNANSPAGNKQIDAAIKRGERGVFRESVMQALQDGHTKFRWSTGMEVRRGTDASLPVIKAKQIYDKDIPNQAIEMLFDSEVIDKKGKAQLKQQLAKSRKSLQDYADKFKGRHNLTEAGQETYDEGLEVAQRMFRGENKTWTDKSHADFDEDFANLAMVLSKYDAKPLIHNDEGQLIKLVRNGAGEPMYELNLKALNHAARTRGVPLKQMVLPATGVGAASVLPVGEAEAAGSPQDFDQEMQDFRLQFEDEPRNSRHIPGRRNHPPRIPVDNGDMAQAAEQGVRHLPGDYVGMVKYANPLNWFDIPGYGNAQPQRQSAQQATDEWAGADRSYKPQTAGENLAFYGTNIGADIAAWIAPVKAAQGVKAGVTKAKTAFNAMEDGDRAASRVARLTPDRLTVNTPAEPSGVEQLLNSSMTRRTFNKGAAVAAGTAAVGLPAIKALGKKAATKGKVKPKVKKYVHPRDMSNKQLADEMNSDAFKRKEYAQLYGDPDLAKGFSKAEIKHFDNLGAETIRRVEAGGVPKSSGSKKIKSKTAAEDNALNGYYQMIMFQ